MSAATAEKPAEPLVSAPDSAVVFLARRESLKLVMRSAHNGRDSERLREPQRAGKRLRFVDGKLRVPPSGIMRGEQGEAIDAKEVLLFLLGDGTAAHPPHPHLGDRSEGFWRHDEAPPVPSQAERDTLAEFGIDLDAAGLKRFIAQEEAGWARPELLELSRSSLARVEAKLAEREAELEKARAEGEAAATNAAAQKPAQGEAPPAKQKPAAKPEPREAGGVKAN